MEAQEQGRLTEADRRRITQLLKIAAGKLQTAPSHMNGAKRKELDVQEVQIESHTCRDFVQAYQVLEA